MLKKKSCSVAARSKKATRKTSGKNPSVKSPKEENRTTTGIFRGFGGGALNIEAVAVMTRVASKNIQNMFESDVDETTTAINGIKRYSKEELIKKYSTFS